MVYGEGDGHPEDCPGIPVVTGWRADGKGRCYKVEACARHAPEVRPRPGPVPSPFDH